MPASDRATARGSVGRPGDRPCEPGRSLPGVSGFQRSRLLNAAIHVVAEEGFGRLTVARVTQRSRVSRRTFYDEFTDTDDCFLAVFEYAVSRAREAVAGAGDGPEPWRGRVRAGLTAFLAFLDAEPALASVLVVEALAAGPLVLARRAEVLEQLKRFVEDDAGQGRGGREPSGVAGEAVVGAVLSVVHARLLAERRDPLVGLVNELMGIIVLPYLGRAAAVRELLCPEPIVTRQARSAAGVSLEGLQMRLTYRTLRVLAAIADEPGASNRTVAQAAGVGDQGQISRLLARLERLALVCNTGEGQPKGEPNAWHLTPRGVEMHRDATGETAVGDGLTRALAGRDRTGDRRRNRGAVPVGRSS